MTTPSAKTGSSPPGPKRFFQDVGDRDVVLDADEAGAELLGERGEATDPRVVERCVQAPGEDVAGLQRAGRAGQVVRVTRLAGGLDLGRQRHDRSADGVLPWVVGHARGAGRDRPFELLAGRLPRRRDDAGIHLQRNVDEELAEQVRGQREPELRRDAVLRQRRRLWAELQLEEGDGGRAGIPRPAGADERGLRLRRDDREAADAAVHDGGRGHGSGVVEADPEARVDERVGVLLAPGDLVGGDVLAVARERHVDRRQDEPARQVVEGGELQHRHGLGRARPVGGDDRDGRAERREDGVEIGGERVTAVDVGPRDRQVPGQRADVADHHVRDPPDVLAQRQQARGLLRRAAGDHTVEELLQLGQAEPAPERDSRRSLDQAAQLGHERDVDEQVRVLDLALVDRRRGVAVHQPRRRARGTVRRENL